MNKQSKNKDAAQAALALAPEEKIFVGCDVHANKYAVALYSPQREAWVSEWVQAADHAALLKRLEPLRAHLARVVYEAGPTGFGLARRLHAAALPVQVIAPSHTARPAVAPDKSDRLDARELARLASQGGMLHPVYIPSELEEQERQVWRIREAHKRRLAGLKQRIKALLLCHGLAAPPALKHWSQAALGELRAMALPEPLRWSLDQLLEELEQARAAVMGANRKLQEMARSERHQARVARLRSAPGVGLIVAMGFLLELMNLERFADRRALSRFLGVCPKVASSGERQWAEGRPELGQAALRSLLVEAAWRWQRGDPYARTLFARYHANAGMKQKAAMALAHKLAVILWRLALGELPYLPGLQRVPKAAAGLAGATPAKPARKTGGGAAAAAPA